MSKMIIGWMVVIFMIGVGVGFYFTPEYAQMNSDKRSSMTELGMADNYFDLRYINNMISHHLAAIDMAKQAQEKSSRPEIKELAQIIITTDERGIEQLYDYKKSWYGDTNKVTRFDKIELGNSDELFDLRFLNALTSHHEMAIESAKDVQAKSTRTEVLNLANDVITNLSANLKQFSTWRKAWYEN
jgi:uncharacterized protein (DUF305 family)